MTSLSIVDGRQHTTTYTDVKDWVALSGVSSDAVALYQLLRMHVNRKRGDDKVRPTTDTLAKMMGRSRGDKISPWLAELVALGAVDAQRVGLAGRYVYTVHHEPPPGYTGPLSLAHWYDSFRGLLEEERAAAKAKREARRAAKAQASSVPPKPGGLGVADSVTPKSGEPVDTIPGELVTPESCREPDVVEPDVVEPPPLTPASGGAGSLEDPTQTPGPCGRVHTPARPCRPCGTNPRAFAAVEESARKAAADAARVVREECPACDPMGWVHDVEPATRCDHAGTSSRMPVGAGV